jgi:hypothetical protein
MRAFCRPPPGRGMKGTGGKDAPSTVIFARALCVRRGLGDLPARSAATRHSASGLTSGPRLPFQANLLRFRAFPGGGVGGNYTASPSNTALHRSWMLGERACGQLASVCSRSVSLVSPCCSMRRATL